MARSHRAKITKGAATMSRKANRRAASKTTRDIAVRAWAAIDAHIEECKEFRRSIAQQRREDVERSNVMHKQNQETLRELAGQVTQAVKDLKNDISKTDGKIDDAELENAKRDLEKEKTQWTWRERIYWGVGSALVGLLAFLLKEKFYP